MERLTKYEQVEGGIPFVTITDDQDQLQRLARFESFMETHNFTYEKVEQRLRGVNGKNCCDLAKKQQKGLLVELPCKVGDKMYRYYAKPNVMEVEAFEIWKDGTAHPGHYVAGEGLICYIIGDDVWLTKQEAQAAQEKLEASTYGAADQYAAEDTDRKTNK